MCWKEQVFYRHTTSPTSDLLLWTNVRLLKLNSAGNLATIGEFSVNFVQENCLLHKQLQQMFNHDFCEDENEDDLALSIEDKQFMKLMKESITKVDNHYQLRLPWTSTNVSFPNNHVITIPKLELSAATAAVKLAKMIRK